VSKLSVFWADLKKQAEMDGWIKSTSLEAESPKGRKIERFQLMAYAVCEIIDALVLLVTFGRKNFPAPRRAAIFSNNLDRLIEEADEAWHSSQQPE